MKLLESLKNQLLAQLKKLGEEFVAQFRSLIVEKLIAKYLVKKLASESAELELTKTKLVRALSQLIVASECMVRLSKCMITKTMEKPLQSDLIAMRDAQSTIAELRKEDK